MRTLVIHPVDSSTDCLQPVYMDNGILRPGFTVIRKSRTDISPLIQEHDRVIMLGHGGGGGLFSMGRFPGFYAIGDHHAELLRGKPNVYVWCFASDYVEAHNLSGFATGMFISEVGEAMFYKIYATQQTVDESNDRFARLLGEHLNQPESVIDQYDAEHPVYKFNQSRLACF